MQSLKELYKVGPGPSSSHTMGPQRAAKEFMAEYPEAHYYEVTLYGSLSLTGKGHLTDFIIEDAMKDKLRQIHWNNTSLSYHPNGMVLKAYDETDNEVGSWTVYSVGGGTIEVEGKVGGKVDQLYLEKNLDAVYAYMENQNLSIMDYIEKYEGKDIKEFLTFIAQTMIDCVDRGLSKEGLIPGELRLERIAKRLNTLGHATTDPIEKQKLLVSSYAYAVSEENATGGDIVTAPTCGASGVLPALMYYYHKDLGYSMEDIVTSLGVAGLFGNIIKQNATISGAEGGCQAEVGTACSMASAALGSLHGLTLAQIEYAAEIAIEHHLGLTCDPVLGYVQIPCIERNGVAALRAIDCCLYAKSIAQIKPERHHNVSFDAVVRTMAETGRDLNHIYRETSLGGLATNYYNQNKLC